MESDSIRTKSAPAVHAPTGEADGQTVPSDRAGQMNRPIAYVLRHEQSSRFASDLRSALAAHPSGIVCMLSAAYLHGLLTAEPHDTWLLLPRSANPSSGHEAHLRRMSWRSGTLDGFGVVEAVILGVRCRISDPARTVIDLLRFSRLLGGEETGFAAARRFLAKGGTCADLRASAMAVRAPPSVARIIRFLELLEHQCAVSQRGRAREVEG